MTTDDLQAAYRRADSLALSKLALRYAYDAEAARSRALADAARTLGETALAEAADKLAKSAEALGRGI